MRKNVYLTRKDLIEREIKSLKRTNFKMMLLLFLCMVLVVLSISIDIIQLTAFFGFMGIIVGLIIGIDINDRIRELIELEEELEKLD